ncbi:ribosome biogenesis GTPase Der [Lacibacterium aquatile]|uniref:GTPase Der n=1 Tax=Lacibacterium aquatile TaxID=1168082 RepID=A0ABW5DN67_9PROT
MTLKVAIVGRPNVGKSTLFNRLVGRRVALVDDTPGVTRDRREGDGHLGDLDFTIIDTAGLEDVTDNSLEARMRRQTEAAIRDADITLFVIDARVGLTETDRFFAALVRRSDKPILLLANKAEGKAGADGLMESYELGLGEPIAISAEHGEGMADLYQFLRPLWIAKRAEEGIVEPSEDDLDFDSDVEGDETDEEAAYRANKPIQMAIVGRPNAGKSTMINALLGEERLLTGPEAGITRDSISVPFEFKGRKLKLVDTAGMRRKRGVTAKLEKLSVGETLRSIRFAEIVVLVLDGTLGLEKQDLTLASLVVQEGRGLVIAINKWDAVKNKDEMMQDIKDRLQISLPQVKGLPIITTSGLANRNLNTLLDAALALHAKWGFRVSTSKVNRWLGDAIETHSPPMVSGRRLKIRYATQIKQRPPTIALFTTRPDELPESYMRYLINSFRDTFGLEGVPVRVVLRKGDNPFVNED